MNQQANYPTSISSFCTCCNRYKIYFITYGILTLALNMLMLSYSIILSYNFNIGTVELRLINKAILPKFDSNYSYRFAYQLSAEN